jgi:hypothetical protein
VPADAIVEITTQILSNDVPKDFTVTHLSYFTTATTVADADFQALANAVKNLWFATGGTATHYGTNGGNVKIYSRADAKPRPVRGLATFVPSTWMTTVPGPRQISLCASMYSSRNIKRWRGRIYLPINPSWGFGNRPDASAMTQASNLVKQLAAVAVALTPVWTLAVWSGMDNANRAITAGWIDDVWDTQRRRVPKATTRTTYTVP